MGLSIGTGDKKRCKSSKIVGYVWAEDSSRDRVPNGVEKRMMECSVCSGYERKTRDGEGILE